MGKKGSLSIVNSVAMHAAQLIQKTLSKQGDLCWSTWRICKRLHKFLLKRLDFAPKIDLTRVNVTANCSLFCFYGQLRGGFIRMYGLKSDSVSVHFSYYREIKHFNNKL